MENSTALTRLHLKNWRSLRDVTIDNLTPITVLVGANSSGKTNILDALHFVRRVESQNETEAAYFWNRRGDLRNLSAEANQSIEIELDYYPDNSSKQVRQRIELTFLDNRLLFTSNAYNSTGTLEEGDQAGSKIKKFIAQRWQLLRADFMPDTNVSTDRDPVDLYVIDPRAKNVPFMLDFMRERMPEIYTELEADLSWLLGHVDKLNTIRDERETRLVISEKEHGGKTAPTISAGTSRAIAMLTAFYALAMRDPELPGLVVIEEPDTAIHPLLLSRLVELLRVYTNPVHERPRQFILTTHNPMMLNLFQPDEVRIVDRDEQGFTTVNPVPQAIVDVWYERYGEYRVGDVWTTRLLGGVPE